MTLNKTGQLAALTGVSMLTAATVAQAAAPGASASWWDILVLGIPLGVLAASLAGSSARSFRDESQPDRTLVRRAAATVIDGFIGGWFAMLLIGFSLTRSYFEGVAPSILGAFGGLLTEYIRTNGARWAEQLYQTFLTWIARSKRPGDTPQ